jgi:hypothetical protein
MAYKLFMFVKWIGRRWKGLGLSPSPWSNKLYDDHGLPFAGLLWIGPSPWFRANIKLPPNRTGAYPQKGRGGSVNSRGPMHMPEPGAEYRGPALSLWASAWPNIGHVTVKRGARPDLGG